MIITTMRQQLSALRILAEYGERFPKLPAIGYSGITGSGTLTATVNIWGWGDPEAARRRVEEGMTEVMDALAVVVGAPLKWTKNDPSRNNYTEKYYELTAELSPVAKITLSTQRETVCERVVVLTGTEEVEERDPELVAKALEAIPAVTVKKPKEIVEWQCNPVLAAKTNESLVTA